MLRLPFSRRLIFDCETSRRSATSSAVMPLSSRSRRSSWPSRRRRTVGLTLDATGRAPPAAGLYFAYLLLSRLPPRCFLPLGNGVYAPGGRKFTDSACIHGRALSPRTSRTHLGGTGFSPDAAARGGGTVSSSGRTVPPPRA